MTMAKSNDDLSHARPQLALDAKTLARLLGVSVRHVRRMDASGKLPAAVRLGRSKRWLAGTIQAWLKAGAPDQRTWGHRKAPGAGGGCQHVCKS